MFNNFAPFADYISGINNTQVDNAKDLDVIIPMYNLTKHSDNYSKTSRSLWQYYRDEPALNANGAIIEFPDAKNYSGSFRFK